MSEVTGQVVDMKSRMSGRAVHRGCRARGSEGFEEGFEALHFARFQGALDESSSVLACSGA